MIQLDWKTAKEYEDITYKKCNGVARIAFNRPNVRNAFRPKTTSELYDAFYDAGEDVNIGVVLLSAEGPFRADLHVVVMSEHVKQAAAPLNVHSISIAAKPNGMAMVDATVMQLNVLLNRNTSG